MVIDPRSARVAHGEIAYHNKAAIYDMLFKASAETVMTIAADPKHLGAKIGVLRRRGLKSLLKDEWEILNAADQQIGTVQEDSWLMATLRRFLTNLIPQTYHVETVVALDRDASLTSEVSAQNPSDLSS